MTEPLNHPLEIGNTRISMFSFAGKVLALQEPFYDWCREQLGYEPRLHGFRHHETNAGVFLIYFRDATDAMLFRIHHGHCW